MKMYGLSIASIIQTFKVGQRVKATTCIGKEREGHVIFVGRRTVAVKFQNTIADGYKVHKVETFVESFTGTDLQQLRFV